MWAGAVEAADPDSDQNIMTDAQLETSEGITDSDFELPNGELLAVLHHADSQMLTVQWLLLDLHADKAMAAFWCSC